jgi:hypothetical protein
MPALVAPFSYEALAKLHTLDVFMTHGEDPTGFQWRSNNVQQQINYDMQNIAFHKVPIFVLKAILISYFVHFRSIRFRCNSFTSMGFHEQRMMQQKRDYEGLDPAALVNKQSDVLIEMTVYKATDPDETLPDDVKV